MEKKEGVGADVTLMDDRDQHESRLTAIALEADVAVGAGNIVQQLLGVLADERLFVVARDVVPGDAVAVNVVQDGHAGLTGAIDIELGVIRLSGLLVAGRRPRVIPPTIRRLVGRRYLLAIRRPEPAIQSLGFEVTSVLAALEVTETTGRPDVRNVVCGMRRHIPREKDLSFNDSVSVSVIFQEIIKLEGQRRNKNTKISVSPEKVLVEKMIFGKIKDVTVRYFLEVLLINYFNHCRKCDINARLKYQNGRHIFKETRTRKS